MTDAVPIVESKFSVVKTVDSGPPAVISKAGKLLAKRAAEARAAEAQKAPETKPELPAPEPVEIPKEAPPIEAPPPAEAQPEVKPVEMQSEKPAEAPQDKEEQAAFKPQLATIAKAEKRIRDDRQTLAQERRAFEEERERFKSEAKNALDLQAAIANDKYKALELLKVDVEDWALKTLGKDKPKLVSTDVEELRKEIQALKAANAQIVQQTQAQQYEAVKKNALVEIAQVLDADPDRYAYTKGTNNAEAVFATIEWHYSRTGEVLPYADAADLVETQLQEQADRFLGVDKFKTKLAPQGEAKATKHTQGDTKAENKSPPQTTTVPDRVPTERLTREERRKRAAAVLSGR